MRKLVLLLINILFIHAAFAQSYLEPLNRLNTYLQKGEFSVKQIEVKDGYLYIYESYKDAYRKASLQDLGGFVDDFKSSVVARCHNDAKCVYFSFSKSNITFLVFYISDPTIRSELTTLFNNFISSYNKDFGIAYVKPSNMGCTLGDCENGTGNFVYADSSKYYGEWKNGKRSGKGRVTKTDGTEVAGKWENDEITGKGKINFPDKYVYEGEIKDNLANGVGTLSFSDDSRKLEYKGFFTNGKLNGKGEYYGLIENSKYKRQEETYKGDFKNGLYDGYGVYELTSHYPKAKVKGLDTKITDDGQWKKGKKYDPVKDRVYSLEEKAVLKVQIDSLKNKIVEVDNLLIANYQHDIDLAKQKKYAELLVGKKWVGEKQFLQPITYYFGEGNIKKSITAEFEMRQELEFVAFGERLDAKITETITLPKSKKITDGVFILIDKYGTNQFGYIEYEPSLPVTSSYTTSTINFNWPEFKLSYAAYSSDYADVNRIDLYKNDNNCRSLIDKYMILLTKCNFKFYLQEGRLSLLATSNNDTVIDFYYEKTTAQLELKDRKDKLEDQISALEKLIANKD